MNPNAQTKRGRTTVLAGQEGGRERERPGPETCLIKYKLEPRIASAAGSPRGENNTLKRGYRR